MLIETKGREGKPAAKLRLLKDRVTEQAGKGAHGQTFYALYKDIKAAYKNCQNKVMIHEVLGWNSMPRDFDLMAWDSEYHIGCYPVTKETFKKILKAAGVPKKEIEKL